MASTAVEYLPRPVRRSLRRNERSAWKGLVAGAAGGFVGTMVMTQFQNAWRKAEKRGFGDISGREESKRRQDRAQSKKESEESENATMKAAGKLARLAGRELTREQRGTASPYIHYGFGTAMGALYGMAMETSPRALRQQRVPFFGSAFGSALFLGADELAVPAAGLTESAERPSEHLYGWLSHVVYGVAAEAVRRVVRSQL
jgi:putative membrane protein